MGTNRSTNTNTPTSQTAAGAVKTATGYPYRRALVTGASSGLGEGLARQLAVRGADLVLVARREERLKQLAAELEDRHRISVEILPADLTASDGLAAVEDRLKSADAAVDLLVNNAGGGVTGEYRLLSAQGEADKVALNVVALMRLCSAALPRMTEARHGGILNMSSLAGYTPSPRAATYAATKAFVTSFSQSLHREAVGTGVHITALLPGPAVTELFDEGRFIIAFPKPLWMTPEDIARRGLDAVASGRPICIPSRLLAAATAIGNRMPRSLQYLVGDRLWRTGSTAR